VLEQAATDTADQPLRQGQAAIGSGHNHINRKIDRMRQQHIVDGGVSPDGLVDIAGFMVGNSVPTALMPSPDAEPGHNPHPRAGHPG